MEELKKTVLEFINSFQQVFPELDNIETEKWKLMIVEDIYTAVYKDDPKYADSQLKDILTLYGLFYETKSGQLIVFLKKDCSVNFDFTLAHELVHVSDYLMFHQEYPFRDYRELQEDYCFRFWSEFHAAYLSNLFFMMISRDNINPVECADEINNKLITYYNSSKPLEINQAINTSVHSYGSYMALQNCFPDDLCKYMEEECYINSVMLSLYNFLWNHRRYAVLKDGYDELVKVINRLG